MMNFMDLTSCRLCPRNCGVNRKAGELGFCGLPETIRAARAALLYCEEPCISGANGSGAIFFTGCNLGCRFCQNVDISGGMRKAAPSSYAGETLTADKLSDIMQKLQEQEIGRAHV